MNRTLIALTTLCTLAACGTPEVPSDLSDQLTRRGGCADMVVYGVDADDTWLLRIDAPGVVEAAVQAGEETTTVLEIGVDDVSARLEHGSQISDAICDDVIENDGPQVDATWQGVGGTVTVTTRPGTEGNDPRSDVTVEGLDLDSGDLFDLSWTDVGVGWFAG